MNTNCIFKVVDGPSLSRIFDSIEHFPEVILPLEFRVIGDNPDDTRFELAIRDMMVTDFHRKNGAGSNYDLEGTLEVREEAVYLPRRFEIKGYNPKTRKGDFYLKKFFESQA